MLDFMWNELDSYEEFEAWMECLDDAQRKDAEVLQRLIILEAFEEDLAQSNYPDAKRVIQAIVDRI